MSANTPHGTNVTTGRYVELTQEAETRVKQNDGNFTLMYPFTDRKVANLWPASTIARPPSSRPLTYILNERDPPLWPKEQYRIANERKSMFFDQASSRVPPTLWFCPPEVSTAAATTRLAQEILGIPNPNITRQLMARDDDSLRDFMNIAKPLWNVALVTYRSCCLSPMLSLDLRVNCMIGAIVLFLSYMYEQNQNFLPRRPLLTVDNLEALSITHDTLDPTYRPDIKSTTHLSKLDGSRRNPSGMFTDSLFHFYCVECGHKSVDYDATLTHEETGCDSSIKRNDFSCTHCNVHLATKEECKIHLSTFCRYTAGNQCPVCGAKSTDTTTICMCGANANLYWDSIRDYLCKKTNKLMRVEHLDIVRALIHLHFLTMIDFAETGSVRDYNVEAGSAAINKENPMTVEDVEVVINALPTMKKEGYIFLPGTEKTWAIADIINLWSKSTLTHERDSDSSSTPSTPKSGQGASTTVKDQWDSFLQYTDETITPAALLATYNGLPKRSQIELLNKAVGNTTLMAHLIGASIVVDLEDLLDKLHWLKSGRIEESDTDSTQNETDDIANQNNTYDLSLVKEINKDKENRKRPQEFGSAYFGSNEEDDEEDTSGGRKNEEDDDDSQYLEIRLQK